MLKLLNGFISQVLAPAIPFLGRIGRNRTTATGVAGVVGTIVARVALPNVPLVNADNIVEIINASAPIAIALFTCIAAFGAGRKAGAS